jgi:hypothetical protein
MIDVDPVISELFWGMVEVICADEDKIIFEVA